jgi:Bacterial toxin homologue of phage lysozyme, C-term
LIDWPFIYAREDGQGGRALDGYWPGGRSGVTIADGVDLGYLTPEETVALDPSVRAKIKPYIGVKGGAADALLRGTPLHLTDAECEAIEAPKREEMLSMLSARYLADAAFPFEDIPDAAQTVLMSVTWQYGDPWRRTPNFWGICCRRDWTGAVAALRHFGDKYPTRRRIEADYLESHLP